MKTTSKRALSSDFYKLLFANCINRFGDSVDALALSWLVYLVTGSAFWSAVYYACNQLPSVIIQPFAGAIVEEHNKKHVMLAADLLRGFAIAALIGAMLCNVVYPAIAILFTLFVSTVEAFRLPAGSSIISRLVPEDSYEYAVSKNTALTTVFELAGTGISGILISFCGIIPAMLLDTVSFLGSSLILFFLSEKEKTDSAEGLSFSANQKQRWIKYKNSFANGIRYAKNNKEVKNLIAEQIKSAAKALSLGGVFTGIIYIAMYCASVLIRQKYLIYIFILMVGLSVGFLLTLISTMLTVDFLRKIEKNHISRIAALYNAVSSAAVPVLALFISILTHSVPVISIILMSGLLCVPVFGVMLLKKS